MKTSRLLLVAVLVLVSIALGASQGNVKSHIYKQTAQGELEILVHLPEGWKQSDKRSAIVFFFGGSWLKGTVTQFEPQARYLASRGMVAARADYRVLSRHGTTPDKCVEDGKSAVRWLRANAKTLGINPYEIIAAGGSAGGHVAACTFTAPGFEAEGEDHKISSKSNRLVLFNPVMDTTPERIAKRMGTPEMAQRLSPNRHISKGMPPTIIFFGTNDRLAAGAYTFMEKIPELGINAELFLASDQGHGFFNRTPWLERTTWLMDRFIARYGLIAGPPTMELPEGQLAMQRYGSVGREYTLSLRPLPKGLDAADFELWLPPSVAQGDPITGVFCSSDYHAGAELFLDRDWRNLADKLGCVCLRYSLTEPVQKRRLSKSRQGAEAILQALRQLAKQTKKPELTYAPLVLTGLSQSGHQATAFANHLASRTIAALPYHESTARHAPELAKPSPGLAVPQLHIIAGRDALIQGIDPWVAKARTNGAIWTLCYQRDVVHHKMGDQDFPLLWLETVYTMRVPKVIHPGQAPTLKPIQITDGWLGELEISYGERRDQSKLERINAKSYNAYEGEKNRAYWLPNEKVAHAWLRYCQE